jgi:glycosyltransferase involved in cell wall biosynthesis
VDDDTRATAEFSVVVPAHNEESVIVRMLTAFVPGLRDGEAEVIVVPNGCTDRTAERAGSVAGVDVVVVEQPSKIAALNAGDQRATVFPRLYIDADVVLSTATVRALVRALDGPEARVACPRIRFVLDGRPWLVRAFYSIYERLPYIDEAMIGSGAYGLSKAGRDRFDRFPDITADDLFIQRLFSVPERIVLAADFMDVQTPRSLKGLLAVRTRTAYGNRELATTLDGDFAPSTGGTMRALVALVRKDWRDAPAAAIYVAVTAIARVRARGRGAQRWHRDDSSR